jgi:heparinase II/III-like protein
MPGQEGSALLADRAVPVLRTGVGSERLQVAVNGMSYVGAHTQPSQLEIELSSGANRLVPAPASIKYADPLHEGWYRQTVSHSTVVVDGKSQGRGQPTEVVSFHAGSLFQAARLRTDSAYPGALLDRTSILTDAGLIDLFQVRAPGGVTLDWVLHHAGQFSTEVTLAARLAPPLAGYKELDVVQEGHADGDWRAGWVQPDNSGTLLWVAGERGTTIISGLGRIGAPDQENAPEPVSALIVRRQAAATTFVSVLLTGYRGDGSVTPLGALRDGVPVGADEAIGLQIRAPRGSFDLFVTLGAGAYQIGGRDVSGGQILVERMDGGATQTEQAALA